jgi:hypothetical protein
MVDVHEHRSVVYQNPCYVLYKEHSYIDTKQKGFKTKFPMAFTVHKDSELNVSLEKLVELPQKIQQNKLIKPSPL